MQADVDGNEADADASFVAATGDRGAIRSEIAAAKLVADSLHTAMQADVDQNESDADASFVAATGDRGAIRSEIAAAKLVTDSLHTAMQADVDGNEADADASFTALQADVDGNEADADASFVAATGDRGAIRSEIAAAKLVDDAALAAVQADVDGNEADADAAIAAVDAAWSAYVVLPSGTLRGGFTGSMVGLRNNAHAYTDTEQARATAAEVANANAIAALDSGSGDRLSALESGARSAAAPISGSDASLDLLAGESGSDVVANSVHLYLNGMRMEAADYSQVGSTISIAGLEAGEVVRVDWMLKKA
jgi:hypothetical protein